jgi:hypothetical protein
MDFSLSDEQQRLVETARKFTREKIIPVAQFQAVQIMLAEEAMK